MKSKPYPSQERLHEIFTLRDHESQPFLWNINHRNNIKIGDVAGTFAESDRVPYYKVVVDGKLCPIHRLVWIYHNGDISDGMVVDHIDGSTTNNRIENLRLCTTGQNRMNSKINSNNTSGVKGIWWSKPAKKWRAQITINGKNKSLGYFTNLDEAKAVVTAERKIYYGDFARHE